MWQPLHVAAELDNAACVQSLLEQKAAVECKDKDGSTPLLWTAQNGAVRSARVLLDANANVNAVMKGLADNGLVMMS